MNDVYLLGHYDCTWTSDSLAVLATPYQRRMTSLQKAVVQTFAGFTRDYPELWQVARQAAAPIFYSSAYGELSAMLHVTGSILDEDLPVSPKEFQHSVQNAAVAYLAMSQDFHQPCYALAGGFLSADNCLFLASMRLRAGLDCMAFIVHAHEFLPGDPAGEARAEVLLLSRLGADRPCQRLRFCQRGDEQNFLDDAPRIFDEAKSSAIPWLLEAGCPQHKRLVRSRRGDCLVTQWDTTSC